MFPLENKYAIFFPPAMYPSRFSIRGLSKFGATGCENVPLLPDIRKQKAFFCLSKLEKAYPRRPTAASLSRDRDPVTHVNPQTLFQALLCGKFFFLLNERINFERMCGSPRRIEGFFSWCTGFFFFHDPSFWRCHTGTDCCFLHKEHEASSQRLEEKLKTLYLQEGK